MQNKNSKINTYLLIIIIIILLAGLLIFVNKKTGNEQSSLPAEQNNVIQESWIVAPGYTILYKQSWTAVLQRYSTPAQQMSGESQVVGYLFILPSGATINWGGNQSSCAQGEFGQFQYGVSTVACVKGMRANLGPKDVRSTLTLEDKKEFGDFVIKNQ